MRELIKINNAQAWMFQKMMIIIQGKMYLQFVLPASTLPKCYPFFMPCKSASNFILKALATMSGRSSGF